jgi:hypothetical protein
VPGPGVLAHPPGRFSLSAPDATHPAYAASRRIRNKSPHPPAIPALASHGSDPPSPRRSAPPSPGPPAPARCLLHSPRMRAPDLPPTRCVPRSPPAPPRPTWRRPSSTSSRSRKGVTGDGACGISRDPLPRPQPPPTVTRGARDTALRHGSDHPGCRDQCRGVVSGPVRPSRTMRGRRESAVSARPASENLGHIARWPRVG